MDARLVVVGGKANKSEVKLKLPAMIGRSRDADVTVSHASVSRHHCLIYELEGALVVRDNGSLNGTVVDGQKIQEALLKPGQSLTIGPLTFRADYEHDGAFPVIGASPTAEANGQARPSGPPTDAEAEPPPFASEGTIHMEPAVAEAALDDAHLEPEPAVEEADAGGFDFLDEEAAEPAGSSEPSFSFLAGESSSDSAEDDDDSAAIFPFAGDLPQAAAQPKEKTPPEGGGHGAAAQAPAKETEDAALDDFLNSLGLEE